MAIRIEPRRIGPNPRVPAEAEAAEEDVAAFGNEVPGDGGVGGGNVGEIERRDWVEAEGFSGAGGEEFEGREIGFLDEAAFSDDCVDFGGGSAEDFRLIEHLRQCPFHCVRWVVHCCKQQFLPFLFFKKRKNKKV